MPKFPLAMLLLGGCGLFGCGAAASNGGAFGSCQLARVFEGIHR